MAVASLFRSRKAEDAPERLGIIDIGSNSIRLVVFDGPDRAPAILFNEKVMAGLGRGMAQTGQLDAKAVEKAIAALGRFRLLTLQMGVGRLQTVATAAVRDASNGQEFLDRLRGLGLMPTLLSGEEEARMASLGVLSGIPDAEGIIGDLGGGSLELARIGGGQIFESMSLPLGVLRIGSLREKGPAALRQTVAKLTKSADWLSKGAGLPFYMVGGSWRALARLDMYFRDFPLPILHGHRMAAEEARRLVRVLAQIDPKKLRAVPGLSSPRIPHLGSAAMLLALLVKRIRPSGLVVSANGLREGLLFNALDPEVRAHDPLICAAREEGRLRGRFPEHGDLLDRWIAPLFPEENASDARLRHAACLLADISWRAHPEFRAELGLEVALHSNWVGIDACGRAMVAHALYTSFGGAGRTEVVSRICDEQNLQKAERWGLALRLGQRLSGGVAKALDESSVSLRGGELVLRIVPDHAALLGESVERRLKALASSIGATPRMVSD